MRTPSFHEERARVVAIQERRVLLMPAEPPRQPKCGRRNHCVKACGSSATLPVIRAKTPLRSRPHSREREGACILSSSSHKQCGLVQLRKCLPRSSLWAFFATGVQRKHCVTVQPKDGWVGAPPLCPSPMRTCVPLCSRSGRSPKVKSRCPPFAWYGTRKGRPEISARLRRDSGLVHKLHGRAPG